MTQGIIFRELIRGEPRSQQVLGPLFGLIHWFNRRLNVLEACAGAKSAVTTLVSRPEAAMNSSAVGLPKDRHRFSVAGVEGAAAGGRDYASSRQWQETRQGCLGHRGRPGGRSIPCSRIIAPPGRGVSVVIQRHLIIAERRDPGIPAHPHLEGDAVAVDLVG
jgi:hypothetical protein